VAAYRLRNRVGKAGSDNKQRTLREATKTETGAKRGSAAFSFAAAYFSASKNTP
jgi:hypothetical protein